MVRRDLTDKQIKADILNRLVTANAFGSYHIPIDQMKSWIQNKIKRNGKTVEKCIKDLVRKGFVVKKARDTIYANKYQLDLIFEYIDNHLK